MTEEKPSTESIPPVADPSPVVRIVKEGRELFTDIGGMALAAYFVYIHAISAQIALVFVLTLVLPSSVLTKYARILLARGGTTRTAAALIGASTMYSQMKLGTILGMGAVSIASCVGRL